MTSRLNIIISVMVLIFAGFAVNQIFADSVTLYPSADAANYSALPDNTYGNTNTANISQDSSKKAFFKFDLSTLPDNVIINSATFYVNVTWVQTADNYYVTVQDVAKDWAEETVTWNEYSSGNSWDTAGGDFGSYLQSGYMLGSTTGLKIAAGGNGLASLVQQWVDGDLSNYGLMVTRAGSSGGQRALANRESFPVSSQAQLLLDYEVVPEPVTVSAMMLGGGVMLLRKRR